MLHSKRGLVLGVSNERSLGWAIAKCWQKHGAKVVIGIQNERFRKKVEDIGAEMVHCCDLDHDEEIFACKEAVGPELDMVMHAVAFAPKDCLQANELTKSSRTGFLKTFETSVYSFVAVGREFGPVLANRALDQNCRTSLTCLTFDGSARVIPSYGLMGPAKGALESCTRYMASEFGEANVRVNAISAGPMNTLAARGLSNFHELRAQAEKESPLTPLATSTDVGETASFLASDLANAITGQIIYVDAGHSIIR